MQSWAGFFSSLLLVATLAGCVSSDDSTSQGAGSSATAPDAKRVLAPDLWKQNLSQPQYLDIESSIVFLDAADGTRLSLSVHIPAGLDPDARIPTLMEVTPYQALSTQSIGDDTTQPSSSWAWYVLRGAAYVAADARGTNGSEGCLDFGGSADRSDARIFTEWVRAQPWSNGVVVTDGVSHPGMGSVVAHAADPTLTAALAHAPVVSYYQDEWLQGAKFEDQVNGPGYQGIELLPAVYTDLEALKAQAATCTGQTALDFGPVDGPFDAKWADRDLSRHAEGAVAPILITQGFVDLNVHPDHAQLYWEALPEDFPKHMVLGWWYHGWPDMRGHAAQASAHPHGTFGDLRHRWLDATLFGKQNGALDEPRVIVEDSKGTWHVGDQWPLEPSQSVLLKTTVSGGLDATGSQGILSYPDDPGQSRGRWEGTHVAFRTEPLGEPRLVNGAPTVHLVASSSQDQTKWVAYLIDEAPDGTWQRISHGYADSHTHAGEATWSHMAPNQVYSWNLRLMPTAVVVEAGHSVILVITSQDSRHVGDDPICFDDYRGGCYNPSGIVPSARGVVAVNSVVTGAEGTTVQLDWVDPVLTKKAPVN